MTERPHIARLLELGVARVLDGTAGMTFLVDTFTPGIAGPVAHVRDYRYRRDDVGKEFQIWSLAADQYELLPEHKTANGTRRPPAAPPDFALC